MEILDALMAGFATAITPGNLLWALVGCALGTAVGVLPGIGPAVAVAGWVLLSQVVQRQPWFGRVVVRGGSWLLVLVAAFWFWQRVR